MLAGLEENGVELGQRGLFLDGQIGGQLREFAAVLAGGSLVKQLPEAVDIGLRCSWTLGGKNPSVPTKD